MVSWVIKLKKLKKPNGLRNLNRCRPLQYAFGSMFLSLWSILFFCTPVFAEGLSGWGNLNYISTEKTEDGETVSKETSYFRNLYLTFENPITPLISYQLYLRTNWNDFRLTDAEDRVTKTYQRAIEPAFDIFLRNPMYDLSAGYRRLEQWTTAHLQNEGRRTTEFIYSRFNITPKELPSLSLQFDRQKDFDYLSPEKIDTTDTRFSGNSWYQYLYKGLNLSYNLTYTYDVNKTPINTIEKTKSNDFNGLYNISYSKSFWSGKTDISASYQGNYIRDKNQFFVSQNGSMSLKRTPFGGFYALGTAPPPEANTFDNILTPLASLVDNNFNTGTINIGTQRFYNIGILVSPGRSVDRLFIYVNRNVTADTNLTNLNNWRAYKSNTNTGGTWQQIPILSVNVSAFNTPNNIYRYEIQFSTAQNASFLKVVNRETVNAPGITDVLVTEIEAYGSEVFSETGKLTEVSNFFNQGINLIANARPTPKLNFSLNYFLNRSDQDPASPWDSIGGVFSNILSNSVTGGDKLKSNILRTYGATTTWFTHRLLTTTMRLQRNEAFDNENETDFSSNTYSLSFNSVPLPTLDANLSLIKSDNYNFGKKDTTNNSALLSIVSKLYRDVNMVTDVQYTQSKSYRTDIKSDTTSIRGSLDAYFTKKLYGSLIYGLSWISSSDNTSFNTADGQMIITYRPGRFINVTGNLRVSDTDDATTTSEGLLVDWLPLPALRLNLSYQHSNSDAESEPSTRDLLSAYFIWYITKFLDLQITNSYTREEREQVTKIYSIGANLNLRIW